MKEEDERNNSDEKEAESSSSSSGKEGSGEGGYSADCSASDEQSLDGNSGKNKNTNNNNSTRGRGGGGVNKATKTPHQHGPDASTVPKERATLSSASNSEDGSDWEQDLDLEAIRSRAGPAARAAPDDEHRNSQDAMSATTAFQELAQVQVGVNASTALAFAQWNGIAITDPMDRRIDFSSLAIASATFASMQQQQQREKDQQQQQQAADQQQQQQQQQQRPPSRNAAGPNVAVAAMPAAVGPSTNTGQQPGCHNNTSGTSSGQINEATMVSLESYARLLEAVRPFFFQQGPIVQPPPPINEIPERNSSSNENNNNNDNNNNNNNNNNLSEQTTSSEGFTSFFTTTDSNTGASKSPESSEEDKKVKARPDHHQPHNDDDDASSLVVLARPKRRYQDGGGSGGPIPYDDDNPVPDPLRPQPGVNDPANVTDARTTSSGTPQESSASAQASSGSGNDAGGKGEGGGGPSSEELATDQATNEQDNDDSGEPPHHKAAGPSHAKHADHQQHHHQHLQKLDDHQGGHLPPDEEQHRKRQDKKRKRIEMRREYEAQQQFESSENSDGFKDKFLRPGKPMALDEAMNFSVIPRILVQSHAPFMVVHTNAAFSRMTGIDSHFVVGRPLSRLLSRNEKDESASALSSQREGTGKGRKQHNQQDGEIQPAQQQQQQSNEPFSLEAFLTSCGNGDFQTIQVNTVVEHIVGRSLILNGPPDVAHAAGAADSKPESLHPPPPTDRATDATHVLCRVGVAPIISAANAVSLAAHHPGRSKRFKQHDERDANPGRIPDGQVVSHYIIHLEPKDSPMIFQKGATDSISSNSSQTQRGRSKAAVPSGSALSDSAGTASEVVAAVG